MSLPRLSTNINLWKLTHNTLVCTNFYLIPWVWKYRVTFKVHPLNRFHSICFRVLFLKWTKEVDRYIFTCMHENRPVSSSFNRHSGCLFKTCTIDINATVLERGLKWSNKQYDFVVVSSWCIMSHRLGLRQSYGYIKNNYVLVVWLKP